MESLSVRRKPCLLRLGMSCPFRKIRRQTYAVSAAASSAIGLYWSNVNTPTSNQPISTACSQSLPHLSSNYNQSDEAPAADVHMEDNRPDTENEKKQQNQKNPENRAENCMELDDCVDPETGERAQ